MNSFNEKVFAIVKSIPAGMVMNYGQVAAAAGNPRCARMVGYALHLVNEGDGIPWHRVVFKDGSVAFGSEQSQLLKAEKVAFSSDGKVVMSLHQWYGAETDLWFS